MKMNLLLIICIILTFFATSTGWAATYYVDFNTGDNSNNGLSLGNAWKESPGTLDAVDTPTDGWVKISKGDTVIFTAGQTWTRPIRVVTTFGNFEAPTQESERITLKSSSITTKAIFDLTGVTNKVYILSIELDYITVRDFEFRNLSYDGGVIGVRFKNTSTESKLLYSYIHDILDTGVEQNSDRDSFCITIGSDGGEIAYNEIKNCEQKLISVAGGDSFLIHHNILHEDADFSGGAMDHGMAIRGVGNQIYNNILWTDMSPPHGGSYAIKVDGLSDGSDNSNNLIYNNLILKWPCGIGILDSLNGGNVIANNTIYLQDSVAQNASSASNHGIGLTGTYVKNNIVRNNIVYYPTRNSDSGNYSAQMHLEDAGANRSGNTITNNLFYYDGSNERFRVGSTVDRTLAWVETNGNWNGVSGNVAENNTIAASGFYGGTHFVSNLPTGFDANWQPNNNGLKLTEGSSAINKGYTLGTPFDVDIEGNSRDMLIDIGAYEFLSGNDGSDSTTPSSPSSLTVQ